AAVMRSLLRATALFIATWFALDAATPFIPGAFQFNADESVEVAHASNQSTIVIAHRPGIAPLFDVALPPGEHGSIRARVAGPSQLRVVRRYDSPRRQDHVRASSVRPSDPA